MGWHSAPASAVSKLLVACAKICKAPRLPNLAAVRQSFASSRALRAFRSLHKGPCLSERLHNHLLMCSPQAQAIRIAAVFGKKAPLIPMVIVE